jgi:adenylate cyclase
MNDSTNIDEPAHSVEFWSQLSESREQSGDYLGACDAALLGLEQHSEARELQYRAILSLSRAGAVRRARQLWSHYRLDSLRDQVTANNIGENIAALGARLEREEAFTSGDTERLARLRKAAALYETIYLRTGNAFPGINAAVLNELSGGHARASEIAADIVKKCAQSNPQSCEEAYQVAADRAAACLLLNDLAHAQKAIGDAATSSTNSAAIASTRKQLIKICAHMGIGGGIISPLKNRSVLHYTGHMTAPSNTPARFPTEAEGSVARQVRRQLTDHNVGYGYGSLACGADILTAEALLERNAEIEVVLPCRTEAFLSGSVVVGGPGWSDRFDNCLKQARVTQATDGESTDDAGVFAYASQLAMGMAILRAQRLCSEIIQLAVWDGQGTTEKAGTSTDIGEWRRLGLTTIVINSESNLIGDLHWVPKQRPGSLIPPRKVHAILLGDFHGFSRLKDRQILTFFRHVMQRVADVLDEYDADIITRNTWGDGLHVMFRELGSAARCALDIQAGLARLDLSALGLPPTLGLRLGLDAGAVFEIRDPVLKSTGFAGSHINRTARLEVTTPPGEVYVTEAFAALFALREHHDLACEYVGLMNTPKGFGRLRTYLLRRRVDFSEGLLA